MEEKVPLLIGLLHQFEAVRTMVFVNTKRTAERLEATLKANGFSAQALSGDVPQNKRLRFLRDFHEGKLAVLIATDVASRGLHIPDVSHVFNFDLPQDPPDYVHRIGRTARAGAEGTAISLIAGAEEMGYLRDIERLIRIVLPREDLRTAREPGHREQGQREPGHREPGHRDAGAANPHRTHRPHAARGNESVQAPKGPRRRRRSGANNNAQQINRQEPRRASPGGGKSEGIQGVAFLHRESRPNNHRNRRQQPR